MIKQIELHDKRRLDAQGTAMHIAATMNQMNQWKVVACQSSYWCAVIVTWNVTESNIGQGGGQGSGPRL